MTTCGSLPTRGAWIEIHFSLNSRLSVTSLPTRGAWIEIGLAPDHHSDGRVAPHAGSVD